MYIEYIFVNERDREVLMRIKGYFTIEAIYIVAFFTGFVVLFINLDFYLHDQVLNDAIKVLGGWRYMQSYNCNYDIEQECIDYSHVYMESSLYKDSWIEEQELLLEEKTKTYFCLKQMGNENEITDTSITEVMNINKNSEIVRAGGEIIKIIGGD